MSEKEQVVSGFRDYPLTIDKILAWVSYAFPNNEVVYWPPGGSRVSVTFAEFADRVRRVTAALMDLGLKPGKAWEFGSKVAVMEWDTLRYVDLFYAVPSIGSTLYTVNIRLAPHDILYTMSVAKPDVLVINIDDFESFIKPILDNIKSIKMVIYMSDRGRVPGQDYGVKMIPYEDLLKHEPLREFPEIDERTPATLLFTSGTTGPPKGVYFTHRQLVLHAMSVTIAMGYPPYNAFFEGGKKPPVSMPLIPLFHVHGWGTPYTVMLSGARKYVLPGRYDWGHILKLIHEEGVTFTGGVPTILYLLLTHPDSPKYNLSSVRFGNGGSAMPEGLYDAAKARGMIVANGYGMTETAPILTMAYLRPEHLDLPENERKKVLLTTGLPIPLVLLRVVDGQGNDVPKDGKTMGELVVWSPWVAKEYLNDPVKTRNAWRDGWFHTEDVAVWLPDGYIIIVDRLKDVVKSGGEWISSVKLESIISTHPGVGEVAVVGVPHPMWGERPVAIVVPKPGQRVTEEEIRNHLIQYVEKGEIPKWWIPDKIIITQKELPKTSTGKIDKKILRDSYKDTLLST
ncbi:MAG: AMP-dependent synthetase [Vulcanisaeta sp. OSP_8]|jgi:Acyl-CoA synthetases (AMP-forming)/AMP-acid ligases II|nr:MAG: AMP-dependent synthetase [Vulcanisaeta sp. OSP_8]